MTFGVTELNSLHTLSVVIYGNSKIILAGCIQPMQCSTYVDIKGLVWADQVLSAILSIILQSDL